MHISKIKMTHEAGTSFSKGDIIFVKTIFVHLLCFLWHLNNYFDFHVCLSIRSSVRPSVRPFVRVSENLLHFLQSHDKMSLIKVAWCVFRVKNMHPGSTSHPSWTAAAAAKQRCVYLILKPHCQSSRC